MINKPARGFTALLGETIKKIDARSINIVRVECESGKVVEIDADEQHYGIGIIRCIEESK